MHSHTTPHTVDTHMSEMQKLTVLDLNHAMWRCGPENESEEHK